MKWYGPNLVDNITEKGTDSYNLNNLLYRVPDEQF